MRRGNLLEEIPAAAKDELFTTLVEGQGVRVERIVSRGHSSPPGFWYEQCEAEFVLVVQGRAAIEFESGERLELAAWDYVDIAAKEKHRVAWTAPGQDTVWLAVFYAPGTPGEPRPPACGRA